MTPNRLRRSPPADVPVYQALVTNLASGDFNADGCPDIAAITEPQAIIGFGGPQPYSGLSVFLLSAIRALDAIWLELLADFHPLAAARAICRAEEFQTFAGAMARDMLTPIPHSPIEPTSNQIVSWFSEKQLTAVQNALAESGIAIDQLSRPPVRDNPQNLAYCPRCHGQYYVAGGHCDSCGGLELRPFANVMVGTDEVAVSPAV